MGYRVSEIIACQQAVLCRDVVAMALGVMISMRSVLEEATEPMCLWHCSSRHESRMPPLLSPWWQADLLQQQGLFKAVLD